MSDTLAERLRGIATFLYGEATEHLRHARLELAECCIAKATEVRALADYVEGRVVAMPAETTPGRFYLCADPHYFYITPDTWGSESNRMKRLQDTIDKRDGRALP